MIIKLALSVAKPPITTLHARHDQLVVELQRHPATSLLGT
jgi:hypothetical protein